MQIIDGSEISVAIDLDQGSRIASLQWRDLQFVTPFQGNPLSWGWFPLAYPFASDGFGVNSGWEDTGRGRSMLRLPGLYKGAVISQHIEVLDDALRWILEYEANGCTEPIGLGVRAWCLQELERGGGAEVISGAIPAITWEGAARIDIDTDSENCEVSDEDSDGICVDISSNNQEYFEALFTFSEGY